MKQLSLLLCLLLMLTSCGSPYHSDGDPSTSLPDHSHSATQTDNVVAHDPAGYCGNTVTTVRYAALEKEGGWERSFWGGISVGLTDFLRWLDYRDEVCRCLPEYYVKTEFASSEYGINLKEGYVRFEGKQTQLTQEQLEQLKTMIEDVNAGEGETICALPPAK